jgi:hypothetical protein
MHTTAHRRANVDIHDDDDNKLGPLSNQLPAAREFSRDRSSNEAGEDLTLKHQENPAFPLHKRRAFLWL